MVGTRGNPLRDVFGLAGDNVIVGSYDRRLVWHDLDLSERPYKTLR